MPIIRRSRPTAPPPAPPAPSRLRRRTIATSASRVAEARTMLDQELKSIANIERELDDAAERLEEAHARAEALMRQNNLTEHSDGVYRATIEEKFSRQERTIDPKKFKNAVADKDFWACTSISLSKAEELLSKKEIAMIVDVKTAKSLGYVFGVKPVKKK